MSTQNDLIRQHINGEAKQARKLLETPSDIQAVRDAEKICARILMRLSRLAADEWGGHMAEADARFHGGAA